MTHEMKIQIRKKPVTYTAKPDTQNTINIIATDKTRSMRSLSIIDAYSTSTERLLYHRSPVVKPKWRDSEDTHLCPFGGVQKTTNQNNKLNNKVKHKQI